MTNKKDKRIVFFCGSLKEGGGERVISILANRMIDDYAVDILLYYDREVFYKIDERINIVSVQRETNAGILQNIKFIREYCKKYAQIVISFLAPFNMVAIFSLLFTKVPIIVADRNDPRHIPSNIFLRLARNFLYHFANGVVFQTERNKRYFSSLIQKKSVIINNPISDEIELGIALNTPKDNTIVTVGRLCEQKNQMMLIDAFKSISDQFVNFKLIIYGEGPYRQALENKIIELELGEKVFLPGQVKDIIKKISSANIFVLPSNFEGMSNALIEAMAIGLPVIVTNVSGSEELIVNGINGVIINKGDNVSLIREISRLLNDNEYCDLLGTNAVKSASQLKSSTIIKKWYAFINRVMEQKK